MSRILEVTALTRSFGGLTAVSNVDLTLEQGEIVGLIGPNGAGKTTSFNLITGVYTRPTAASASPGRTSSAWRRTASPASALPEPSRTSACSRT